MNHAHRLRREHLRWILAPTWTLYRQPARHAVEACRAFLAHLEETASPLADDERDSIASHLGELLSHPSTDPFLNAAIQDLLDRLGAPAEVSQ